MKSFLSLQKFQEDDTQVWTINCQQRNEQLFSRKIHSGARNSLSRASVEWGDLRRDRAHRIKNKVTEGKTFASVLKEKKKPVDSISKTPNQNVQLAETLKIAETALPPSQETVNSSLPQDLLANKEELADFFRLLKQMQIILAKVTDVKKPLEEMEKTEDPSNKLYILAEELNDNI
ncbi:hypothetical protein AVEN_241314-1 [Araneus ventricosus]|uniref:Uncharacterized protein n=1 Tax=Araneus ventricosus TaxID=182803 RepID=A0A4Y2MD28_ARAVE|nr:hypothetical protein AVEN_241314-1 [Araneus ventricosus]